MACVVFIFYCCHALAATAIVTLNGVPKEIEENIRANLSMLQEDEEIETDSVLLEQYRERAHKEILLALQPFGYYSPKITSQVRIQVEQAQFTFQIQLGEPVRIGAIHFQIAGEGQDDPDLRGLSKEFTLKIGDIFLHEQYEQDKKALLSKTIQEGYLTALFIEHRVEVNPRTNRAQVFLTLQTGPRHYFGQTSFSQSALSESLLRRYLTYTPGETYEPEKLLLLQSHLSQSDYFANVNVKALPQENDTVVPVLVELEDAKPNHYQLGAGYGTDTGMRGKVAWTRRRLNSLGHRLEAQAQVSEIYHKIEAAYIIPGKKPHTDRIKIKGGFFDDEFSEKPSQIYETSISEEREIFGWQRRLALTYHHERFNELFITDENEESQLILPSVTFIQSKRDNPVTPRHGRRIEFTVRGSVDALFSDTNFLQTYLQVKWLRGLGESTKLLLRTELGATIPDDPEHLPLSQRFFAGGDLSLRGYGYRSLPSEIDKDGTRHPVGGAYLAIGSIELVRTVRDPIGVFTFFDAGNAFRQSGNQIAMGTGIGIEWQTRLGPIKFAIAKPLTKSADAWRIHASFGPEL